MAHCPPTAAHVGIQKTLELLRRFYYWPQMAKDVHKFIMNCETCKLCKPMNSLARPPMGNYIEISRPWQKLYIDFLGPYPRSKTGNCYLFIVLDHFSRFVLLEPMRDATTSNVTKFLEAKVFNVFSVPEIVFSDNGKQFTAKIFKDFFEKFGIKHVFTPKYHPQPNASERVNRSILAAIRAYIRGNHTEWDKHIHSIGCALRNVVHASTNQSPHFLVFGQHYIGHASNYNLLKLLNSMEDKQIEVSNADRLSCVQQEVIRHLKKAYENSASTYNLRSRQRNFHVGQQVFVRHFLQSDRSKKFSAKLSHKFRKAFIHKPIGSVAYEVQDSNGKNLGIYHIKDIRL